jgi:hypothetical protein
MSLPEKVGCDVTKISGRPDFRHVSTSFVEQQTWTVRTNIRGYTRLLNGFSRRLTNYAAARPLGQFPCAESRSKKEDTNATIDCCHVNLAKHARMEQPFTVM